MHIRVFISSQFPNEPYRAALMATMVSMNTGMLNGKDSRWLQLEVCREFQRNKCTRPDTECKFSHPAANVEIQNGRVTACYDSIKVGAFEKFFFYFLWKKEEFNCLCEIVQKKSVYFLYSMHFAYKSFYCAKKAHMQYRLLVYNIYNKH